MEADSNPTAVLAEITEAIQKAESGNHKDAIKHLEGLFESTKLNDSDTHFVRASNIIGQLYAYLGDAEKALAAWKKAIELLDKVGTATPQSVNSYISLCYNIAQKAEEGGKNGSGFTSKKRSVCYGPTTTGSDEEEEKWKKTRFDWAIEYLEKAIQKLGDSDEDKESKREFRSIQANCLMATKNLTSALAIYEQSYYESPDEWHLQVKAAKCLIDLGRQDEAVAKLLQLIEKRPDAYTAYGHLIKFYKEQGDNEKVKELKQKEGFYQWVPAFCKRITPTPANIDLIHQFEKQGSTQAVIERINTELKNATDIASTEMLAAICYHHYHGSVEDAAFDALLHQAQNEARREEVSDVVIEVLENHQSVCTIKGVLKILATIKHERAFTIMRNLLPQDLQMFRMGVAKSLGLLGDERAIPLLLKYVGTVEEDKPAGDDSDSDDDFFMGMGQDTLRYESLFALATSFYSNPQAQEAIVKALDDKDLKPCAHAALWYATRKEEHFAPLVESANKGELDYRVEYFLRDYAHTDEVKEIIEKSSAVKKEEEEKKRIADEKGVENWCPTEDDLKKWGESGQIKMAHYKAQTLHEKVFTLANTKEIELCDNRLTDVPKELSQLPNLTKLNLQANRLTGPLSENIGLLTNLTSLGFHGNQITTIPDSIGNLTNLTELTLSCNKLESVSPLIGNLINLTTLHLDRNAITSLPAEIGKLTNLTKLDVSGNKLQTVPDELGNLVKLTSMFLYNNQLTRVPATFTNLTNLTLLNLTSNPLEDAESLPAQLPFIKKGLHFDKKKDKEDEDGGDGEDGSDDEVDDEYKETIIN